jgi:hypothetical protein
MHSGITEDSPAIRPVQAQSSLCATGVFAMAFPKAPQFIILHDRRSPKDTRYFRTSKSNAAQQGDAWELKSQKEDVL